MSPRFDPATALELTRATLLAGLPGETLRRLAGEMRREDGERFYIVLSGMLTVTQEAQGPRRVLRPGDYFGEVAVVMGIPRTATVRALTPATVASCDRETFDRYLRTLFADED